MRSVGATANGSTPVPMITRDAVPTGVRGKDRNKVLDQCPALSAMHFICREPRYVGALRRGFWGALGSGLACSALLAPTIPWPLAVLLWTASGLALLAAVRQASATIHFASDAQGLYFPSRQRFARCGQTMAQTWLLVPWANVSAISVQLLLDESGRRKGVTFKLRASEEERRVYFPRTVMLGPRASLPAGNHALISVGYPGASMSPEKIVARLRGLLNQSNSLAAD